jgi:hypothetical protein
LITKLFGERPKTDILGASRMCNSTQHDTFTVEDKRRGSDEIGVPNQESSQVERGYGHSPDTFSSQPNGHPGRVSRLSCNQEGNRIPSGSLKFTQLAAQVLTRETITCMKHGQYRRV